MVCFFSFIGRNHFPFPPVKKYIFTVGQFASLCSFLLGYFLLLLKPFRAKPSALVCVTSFRPIPCGIFMRYS